MRISTVICTRDRASLLERCLGSLCRVQVPSEVEWELVVVDNGSQDRTPEVLAGTRGRLPLVAVEEPEPGLSSARNRGVAVASGDYVSWTDDDVVVDEDWLAAYAAAFRQWPETAVFGGPILPLFEGTPPPWLEESLQQVAGAFALRDLGSEPVPLSAPGALPFGANYAVRSREQRRHLYRTDLGRRPGALGLGHEETDVVERIFRDGGTGRWVPEARVKHWIPRSKQTRSYLRSYFRAEGTFMAREGRRGGARIPGGLLRTALTAELRYRVRRAIRPPERWIPDLIVASQSWGRLLGSWNEMPSRPPRGDDPGTEGMGP